MYEQVEYFKNDSSEINSVKVMLTEQLNQK